MLSALSKCLGSPILRAALVEHAAGIWATVTTYVKRTLPVAAS